MATIDRCPLIVFMLGMAMIGCAEEQPEKPKPKTYTEAEVLELLLPGEFEGQRTRLINAGTSLYPVYESIFANPDVSPEKKALIYIVLDDLKCKNRRFYPYAIEHLQNMESNILRVHAKELLWSLATREDMQVLSVLIDDIGLGAAPGTAAVLAEVGDYNALASLTVWLAIRVPWYQKYMQEPAFVHGLENAIKCRDELKARLDKMEQPDDPK